MIQSYLSPSKLDALVQRGGVNHSPTFTLLPSTQEVEARKQLRSQSTMLVPQELQALENSILIFNITGAQVVSATSGRSSRTIFHNPQLMSVKYLSTVFPNAMPSPYLPKERLSEFAYESLVTRTCDVDEVLGSRMDLLAVTPVQKVISETGERFWYLKRLSFVRMSRLIAMASAMAIAKIVDEEADVTKAKWIAHNAIKQLQKETRFGISKAHNISLEINRMETNDGTFDFHLLLRRSRMQKRVIKDCDVLLNTISELSTVDGIINRLAEFKPIPKVDTLIQDRWVETALTAPTTIIERELTA